MTAFQAGDRVLVEGQLVWVDRNGAGLSFPDWGGHCVFVSLDLLRPVPEPEYVDPELVPGMVVAPLDAADTRQWWVIEGESGFCFVGRADEHVYGEGFPKIRVVFDPRKATS